MLDAYQTATLPEPTTPQNGLRVWPFWLLVIVQVVLLVITVTPAIDNLTRFLIMMAGPLGCGFLFFLEILTFSRMKRLERIALPLIVALTGIGVGYIADSTVRVAIWIYGGPLCMFAISLVSTILRKWDSPMRLGAFSLSVVVAWGVFAIFRLDGFDGSYWPELALRWSPTAEQKLIDERKRTSEVDQKARTVVLKETDWPGFRGGNRNSRVSPAQLAPISDKTELAQVWKTKVGPGWSSLCVVGNTIYTQEQLGEEELVSCFDAATGNRIWQHVEATRFFEVVAGAGPRATPTFDGGRVYSVGATGIVTALDASNGALLWKHDLMKEFDAPLPQWGFSSSPLIVDGLAIVYAGSKKDGKGILAFDAIIGELKWSVAESSMNFSSPQLLDIADSKILVFGCGVGIKGFNLKDGKELWSFTPTEWSSAPMVQPQAIGKNSIVVALGDGTGVARLEVERNGEEWKVSERWSSRGLRPAFNDFLYSDGCLYGFDQNIFVCIDAETGKRLWKQGRYGFGQAVLLEASQQILVLAESGELVLLACDRNEHRELKSWPAIEGKTWNHPVIANGKIYVRNSEEAACFEVK